MSEQASGSSVPESCERVDETVTIARILSEGALVIASATFLLYLASHIFASEYLAVFGVGLGLQGVGLAPLGMLPLALAAYPVLFCDLVYNVFTTERRNVVVLGLGSIVVMGAVPVLLGVCWRAPSFACAQLGWLVLAAGACVGVMVIRRLVRKHREQARKVQTSERELATLLDQLLERGQTEKDRESVLTPQEWKRRLDALRKSSAATESALHEARRAFIPPSHDELRRLESNAEDWKRFIRKVEPLVDRVQSSSRSFVLAERNSWVWRVILAGYLTAFLALPALAKFEAVVAITEGSWKPANPRYSDETPVYWVGDREVYVTSGNSGCYVHVKIANVEQGKRTCPPLIAAIEP